MSYHAGHWVVLTSLVTGEANVTNMLVKVVCFGKKLGAFILSTHSCICIVCVQ